jgi:hypothetical protein
VEGKDNIGSEATLKIAGSALGGFRSGGIEARYFFQGRLNKKLSNAKSVLPKSQQRKACRSTRTVPRVSGTNATEVRKPSPSPS